MIPPEVFSSALRRRITTRSCNGRNFIGLCLTWCRPLKAGLLAPDLAGTLQVQVIWRSGPESAKHLARRKVVFKLQAQLFGRNWQRWRIIATSRDRELRGGSGSTNVDASGS
jgi:hypothetical protein